MNELNFGIKNVGKKDSKKHKAERFGWNDNSVIRVTEKRLYMLDTITEELIFCD